MFDMLGLSQLKIGIYAIIAGMVLMLGLYCKTLKEDNTKLSKSIGELTVLNEVQGKTMLACSDGTAKLKDREAEITENAKVALAEAKKEAEGNYKRYRDIIHRQPKEPVVTKDNEQEYGGSDIMIQLKDYLSAHDLANEEIDLRLKNKKYE